MKVIKIIFSGKQLLICASLVGCAMNNIACNGNNDQQRDEAIKEVFQENMPSPVQSPVGMIDPGCFNERFIQPKAEITRKIDILFVTDTSGSLNDERKAVADGIDSFVAALPQNVDYQIAVMLAHGKSQYAGKLYKKKNEERILASSSMTLDQIRTDLKYKLTDPASETASDGGEVAMASLNQALDNGMLTSIRAHGFFREDAALAVIFMSDENDICAKYPEGVIPVFDADRLENSAKKAFCTRKAPARPAGDPIGGLETVPATNEEITPALVYEKLKKLQSGRPLLIGGIVYNNLAAIPPINENEYGYGYMDLINSANGISVDIGSGNFDTGLSKIGTLASIKLNLLTEFELARQSILVDSIDVTVDGVSVDFSYNSTANEVQVTQPGGSESVVDIDYCLEVPGNTDGTGSGDTGTGDTGTGDAGTGDTGAGDGACTGFGCDGWIGI